MTIRIYGRRFHIVQVPPRPAGLPPTFAQLRAEQERGKGPRPFDQGAPA